MLNFYGNTTPAIDYGSMQQAMSLGLQGQQPVNSQGPLNTQNWVKNDMLPPQYQLQDQLGKMAVQNNTVSQLPIANALQQQILAHQFGDNQMQGAQMQMLRQQIQAEQFKNQVTNPEAIYQSTQQDLANHAKMFQDNYGVNIGEAASDLGTTPFTDSTGRQTTVKKGYDPSTGVLYIPPKNVMNPMLGTYTSMPPQQIDMPLGMHMLAKEVGARQAGFQSFSDMQSKYNLQTLAQAAAQLQQQKTIELGKYSAANPYGSTSPDVVSNGAPTLPGTPMSPGISMNPAQFAGRQAQLQQQSSQEFQRYSGTSAGQAPANYSAATIPSLHSGPNSFASNYGPGWNIPATSQYPAYKTDGDYSATSNPMQFAAMQSAMGQPSNPDDIAGAAKAAMINRVNPFDMSLGVNAPQTTGSSIHNYFTQGAPQYWSNVGSSAGGILPGLFNFAHQVWTGDTDSPYSAGNAAGMAQQPTPSLPSGQPVPFRGF